MKIGIASDHRGFETKQNLTNYLKTKGYTVIDYGTDSKERVDYTKYGFILGEHVASSDVDYGIAICGSAIGISIACNKVKGIRCGKINNEKEAIHAKENDFVNIIALSGEEISLEENAKENTVDETYLSRVKQIMEYEQNAR